MGTPIKFEDLREDQKSSLLRKIDRLALKYNASVTVDEITRGRWTRARLIVHSSPKRFIRIFSAWRNWSNSNTMQIEGGPSASTKARRISEAWQKWLKIEGAKRSVLDRMDLMESEDGIAMKKLLSNYDKAVEYLESVKDIVVEMKKVSYPGLKEYRGEVESKTTSLHERFMKEHGEDINIDL